MKDRSELYLDVGAFLLQLACDAGDGPARSSSRHQHVYFTCRCTDRMSSHPKCHTHTHTFTARCDSVCTGYHRTAPGSPLPWCRSEPAGYSHSGTDPEYGSWGSHSSGTRPRPRETPESQNGRRSGSEQSQHQEHAARPPELHNKITLYITFNTNPKATTF